MAQQLFANYVAFMSSRCAKIVMLIFFGPIWPFFIKTSPRNNDFHNTTDCITIDGYHPDHRELVVKVGNLPAQKAYKILQGIEDVYDVIKTNLSQAKGKYFVLCDREHRREVERMVHEVLKAITLRITDECDEMAEKQYE